MYFVDPRVSSFQPWPARREWPSLKMRGGQEAANEVIWIDFAALVYSTAGGTEQIVTPNVMLFTFLFGRVEGPFGTVSTPISG